MSLIANNITETIGNTPLVRINRLTDQQATVLAKMESFNPASSVKDRIAVAIVDAAEASGQLPPGGKLVEATSGNTGVALAMVGAARGYQVVICMPSSMSVERRLLMRAFGAELILTDPKLGMRGAVSAAEELVAVSEGAVLASQFANPANPATHVANTGEEIWEATQGEIDILVAGVGTGGTISGAGAFLKQQKPDLQIVALEPADSPLISTGQAGPHGIQGIGANFIPENLNLELLDEVLQVPTDEAMSFARRAAAEEGMLVGISAGAALWGAAQLAARPENVGKTIVTILPDTGERYLSTALWQHLAD